MTPERLFGQQWAITLLARVLDRLEDDFKAKGKLLHFDQLKKFLSGTNHKEDLVCAARELGMSEKAVVVAA